MVPADLRNRLGIAIAAHTYKFYRELLVSPRWRTLAAAGARPQRLLWASTGTKDPKASETLYIEALTAPDTINTMPEQTLHALTEHGELKGAMAEDGGGRSGARTLYASRHRCRGTRETAAARRRKGVREVVAGASAAHQRQECGARRCWPADRVTADMRTAVRPEGAVFRRHRRLAELRRERVSCGNRRTCIFRSDHGGRTKSGVHGNTLEAGSDLDSRAPACDNPSSRRWKYTRPA